MTNLEQELQESIKKNLPQQVGDVLKERLAQADRDTITIKDQQEKLAEANSQIDYLQKEIRQYKQFDERNTLLESREKELETERNTLELEKLKYQLQAEKDKTQFSQNVALGLVRNTEYRKTIFDSEDKGGLGVIDGQGNYHYPMPTSKSYSETRVEE